MASTFELGFNPQWQFTDSTGKLAVGGKIFTFSSLTRAPKSVFKDPAGVVAFTNPIVLNGVGAVSGPIYFEDDGTTDRYFITVTDASGNIIFEIDQYLPETGGSPPINLTSDIENFLINGQFRFQRNNISRLLVVNEKRHIAPPGWFFITDDISVTKVITFQTLPISPAIESDPRSSFRYSQTLAGGSTNKNDLFYEIPNVYTLENTIVTMSFQAKGTIGAGGEIIITQNFGTGGAPSAEVETPFAFTFPSPAFGKITSTFTIPSITGKSLGTNADDFIRIGIRFPLNTVGDFDVTNMQVELGTIVSPAFIYQTDNQTNAKIKETLNGSAKFEVAVWKTGDIRHSITTIVDPGWIEYASATTLGNTGSGATHTGTDVFDLFVLLWDSVIDTYAPVSTGRGASALDDWNAGKTISLPRGSGRVIGISGIAELGITARANGEFLGEEDHTLTVAELASHTHPIRLDAIPGTGTFPARGQGGITHTGSSDAAGGDQPHNNMQPTVFYKTYIKL